MVIEFIGSGPQLLPLTFTKTQALANKFYCLQVLLTLMCHFSWWNYTQSLLIRNGGKFWLVLFLIFRLILYGLCFLFFSWFCIVVSYFFLDFLRSFLIFFKNFDTSHMYVVWGGKPYKMKKPMRWKTNYFSKSSNSPLSLYNYV